MPVLRQDNGYPERAGQSYCYEEPAFDLLRQPPSPSRRGTGRIGELPAAMTLRPFTALAAAVLPATAWGIRAAGDPNRPVHTVAVCGGSGGSLAGARGPAPTCC